MCRDVGDIIFRDKVKEFIRVWIESYDPQEIATWDMLDLKLNYAILHTGVVQLAKELGLSEELHVE